MGTPPVGHPPHHPQLWLTATCWDPVWSETGPSVRCRTRCGDCACGWRRACTGPTATPRGEPPTPPRAGGSQRPAELHSSRMQHLWGSTAPPHGAGRPRAAPGADGHRCHGMGHRRTSPPGRTARRVRAVTAVPEPLRPRTNALAALPVRCHCGDSRRLSAGNPSPWVPHTAAPTPRPRGRSTAWHRPVGSRAPRRAPAATPTGRRRVPHQSMPRGRSTAAPPGAPSAAPRAGHPAVTRTEPRTRNAAPTAPPRRSPAAVRRPCSRSSPQGVGTWRGGLPSPTSPPSPWCLTRPHCCTAPQPHLPQPHTTPGPHRSQTWRRTWTAP